LARRQICAGHKPATVFNQLFYSLGYRNFYEPPHKITQWLDNLEQQETETYLREYKPALQTIQREFALLNEKRRKKRQCPKGNDFCQLTILNERYSMDLMLCHKKRDYALYLVDSFYGYKRLVSLNFFGGQKKFSITKFPAQKKQLAGIFGEKIFAIR
jgi:hypothetical protein